MAEQFQYEFRRFVDGRERAEDVGVRAEHLEHAVHKAAYEVRHELRTTLVYVPSASPPASVAHIVRVQKTPAGPILWLGDVAVREWLGTDNQQNAEELAELVRAALTPAGQAATPDKDLWDRACLAGAEAAEASPCMDPLGSFEDGFRVALQVLGGRAATPSEPADRRRERLLDERHRLENSYGNTPARDGQIRDRIAEIDAQLAGHSSQGAPT